MGFFTASKPLITKEEKIKMLNELRSRRDANGNRVFNELHVQYVDNEFEGHMDADAPGQPPGITQEEEAQVMKEISKPTPFEQSVQRRFGIKYGFSQEQVNILAEVGQKYLKK